MTNCALSHPNVALRCAVLMLHGSNDPVCSAEAAERALRAIAARDKTWVALEGALHDLDMDMHKADWFAACRKWLDQRFP
jgi:alpha-beta hydrolase superfamily lysophospholipase